MDDGHGPSLIDSLRRRNIVQVLVLYAGLAWGLAQLVEFFVDNYDVSRRVLDATLFLLAVGLPAAGVLAWFHGEKGHQRVQRSEAVALAALAVIAAVGLVRIGTADPPRSRDLEAFVDLGSHSVAVLPFGVSHPELAWLRLGAAELLTTGLASHDVIRVVSGQRLYDLLRREGYEDATELPPGLGTDVTRRAGARYLIDGSVLGSPDDVVLRADLVDVETGDVAASSQVRGTDVFALIDRIGADLADQVAGQTVGADELTPVGTVTRSPQAYREYLLGLLAERRFHDAEARAHFQAAVDLDATFALAQMRLALVSLKLGDVSAGLTALQAARQYGADAPRRDRMFIEALRANIGGGASERAREILEELLVAYPDDREVRALLAEMYPLDSAERGRLLEESIRLDPLNASALNSLAYFEARRGAFDAADSLIARYVELEPTEPNPRDSRGEILMMAGRHDEAREAFRKALELSPGFGPALRHLADSWASEGRFDEGRAELEAYAAAAPEVGTALPAYGALGVLLTRQGRLRDAAGALDRARRLATEAGDPAAANGQLLWQLPLLVALGDWEAAERKAGELIATDPLNPFAHYVRFHVAGERGDLAGAAGLAEDIMGAVRTRPEVAEFADLLEAVTNRELALYRGDFEGVVEWQARIRDADGWPELGSYATPRALVALDRPEDAEREAWRISSFAGVPHVLAERLRLYYVGRAREARADSAGAIEAYDALLRHAWSATAAEVPLIVDAPDRRAALSRSDD